MSTTAASTRCGPGSVSTATTGRISSRDALMERGLAKLGWHVDEMPRNVDGCDTGIECGRCGPGCRIGAKQSATKTWLVDAQRGGARLVVGVDVRTVTVKEPAGRPASPATRPTVTR